MKRSLLALSITSALAIPAGVMAAPWNPATFNAATDFAFRMSGATAPDTLIQRFLETNVCQNSFARLNGPAGSSAYGYACTRTTALTLPGGQTIPAGQRILFIKYGFGGSASGVYPLISAPGLASPPTSGTLAAPTALDYLAPTTCTGGTGTPPTYTCAIGTNNAISDAGISDVDPLMFGGISGTTSVNRPVGYNWDVTTAIRDAYLQNTTVRIKGVYGEVFGVAVSNNLYNCLQAAQGLTVGSTTVANRPTLSKDLVQSLMRGAFATWNSVRWDSNVAGAANVAGTSLIDRCAALGQPRPTDIGVKIVRRVAGSGTQAVANRDLFEAPCNPRATATQVMRAGNINTAQGLGVVMGSGTGDVVNGLTAWDNGVATTINSDPVSFGGLPQLVTVNPSNLTAWAIGVVAAGRAETADWKFVKFNGEFPSERGVHDGKYPMWAEATIQYRVDAANTPTAQKRGFAEYMKANMGLNANFPTPPALPGYVSLSTVGTTNIPEAEWLATATNRSVGWTRTTAGATGTTDNCRVPSWNTGAGARTPLSDDTP